jgi:Chalcone isomerase-like
MQRRRATVALSLLPALVGTGAAGLVTTIVQAQPSPPGLPTEVATTLPRARLNGRGRLRFFGLHVYDIRLWSLEPLPASLQDWARHPLALEIEYARGLVGKQIAERSLEEMKRVGTVSETQAAQWLGAMTRLFPDVKAGDRITGVQLPAERTQFFLNARPIGEVADAEFTRLFFGIWLSPRTSEPALREALLSAAASAG